MSTKFEQVTPIDHSAEGVVVHRFCSAWVKLCDSRPPEGALVAVRQPVRFYSQPLLWLCGEVAKKGQYDYIVGATTGNPIMLTQSAIWLLITRPNVQGDGRRDGGPTSPPS